MDEKILNLLSQINNRFDKNDRLISIESDVTDLKDNKVISDVLTEVAAAFSRK